MMRPISRSGWNYNTASHLASRAGFGATPEEIERLVRLGPEAAVSEFVDYEETPDETPAPDWAKPDPERMAKLRALRQLRRQRLAAGAGDTTAALPENARQMLKEERRLQTQRLLELREWWLARMARGPRPLQEKLVLFWHGHFATSSQKVRDTYYMWRQNETFREHASGNWLQLLTAVAKDPAMLVWLDQAQSRRSHPNENFARELMELFTLGEGHYTEKDVTEAARALTGWSLNQLRQQFERRSQMHDPGEKTLLGKTGNLAGRDVLEQIVAQPQTDFFISGKLWAFFASDTPNPAVVAALAKVFRDAGQYFKPALRTLFLGEEFYDPAVMGAQIKSPVQWLAGSVRLLDRTMPGPVIASQMTRNQGQELFAPPNVKGWDGGASWITTSTLLARYNAANTLVAGLRAPQGMGGGEAGDRLLPERLLRQPASLEPVDVGRVVPPKARRDTDLLIAALEKRFLRSPLKEKQRQTLKEFVASRSALDDDDIRHTIRLVMSTPEYQLI
jgi:uncharacterized protein (DUF1800 family)